MPISVPCAAFLLGACSQRSGSPPVSLFLSLHVFQYVCSGRRDITPCGICGPPAGVAQEGNRTRVLFFRLSSALLASIDGETDLTGIPSPRRP